MIGATIVMLVVAETTYTMTPQVGAVTVCTLVILAQVIIAPGGPVQALLEWQPLRWLGRRSYAVYLYHYVIITAWDDNSHGLGSLAIKLAQVAYRSAPRPSPGICSSNRSNAASSRAGSVQRSSPIRRRFPLA